MEKCADCYFFKGNSSDGGVYDGSCKRQPPQIVPLVGKYKDPDGNAYCFYDPTVGRFPAVFASDWCGEFVNKKERRRYWEEGN